MKVVLASGNKGKLLEFSSLLSSLKIELISQSSLEIPSCEEPFDTFIENALTKARHVSHLSGLPALADDSGLCVDALNGQPGVLSARYAKSIANPEPSDEDNNKLLIERLRDEKNRQAHFVCTLVYVRSTKDPEPLVVTGRWHGTIVDQAVGKYGFGYDPHFFIPELGKTAAELLPEEKNQLSHRGQAMQELYKLMQPR